MQIVDNIYNRIARRFGYQRAEVVWQFVKFGLVGVMNTLITLAVIYLLMYLFDVNYRLANISGYVVGLANSFVWSKLWVFARKEGNTARQISIFLINFGICYLLQYGALTVMVEQLGWNTAFAQLAAMVVYTVLNFVINRTITFK